MSTTTTRSRRHILPLLPILLCLSLPAWAESAADSSETHPFNAQDLVTMARISDPQVPPDGSTVVFGLRTTDLEADRGRTDFWLVPVDGSEEPRRLTTHPASEWNARFAADGESIYFLSTRSGSPQVWNLRLDGGEAVQITDLPVGIGNLVVSPSGEHLAFSTEAFADCEDLACTAKRLEDEEKSPTTGRLYDRLFVRHWDTWKDGRRSHLFVWTIPGEGEKAAAPLNVSGALDADVPAKPFGGPEEITFTPDGRGIVFTARTAGREEPWSTNFDLFHASLSTDGDGARQASEPQRLTDNPAWDTHPVFSPDGKTFAYAAMQRPGFEADRFRIILRSWKVGPSGVELGAPRALTEEWDRSPSDIVFSPDGKTIYTTAGNLGNVGLFAIDVASAEVREIRSDGHARSPSVTKTHLVYGLDHLQSPVELYALPLAGGEAKQLTEVNGEALAKIRFGEPEQFSFPGWNDEKVHGWLVKPVDFDPAKKYPLAFLIHGGPQGSFDNDFHYRWNPQSYAGAGYAAVMIDFHGSTGYGQEFTDSISGDWGGKPLEDLQKGLAWVLDKHPWIDGDSVCALGASYGGYMINWIEGNWPDRFDCLVNHDGLFDLRSMYYSTEELWFPEWDVGGTPFANPENFERFNPARFVDRWKTPMLVVHGALDYRVVDTQGLQTFTALQRRGIPSQLLYYPDENHWVLKPNNSLQWHETVLAWLDRWLQGDE